jgi:glycosyltransferase involved in cell wall biosynthesis
MTDSSILGVDSRAGAATSDDFLTSYRGLMEWVRSRVLAETDLEDLLHLAVFYGTLRWNNSDGIYHDDEVEQSVAEKILHDDHFQALVISGPNPGCTVLIASELYDAGGHSRIVRHWLKSFQSERDHRLLVTRTVTKRFEDFLKANGHSYAVCRAQGVELVQEIIQHCGDAQRVVLHIHPNDIASATAARYLARAGKEIIFFNHADHAFSYGISSASVVCEVSSYGITLNRKTKRARRSCYLGIPIDGKAVQTNEPSRRSQIVFTCGFPYKYQPTEVSFSDFIDQLLLRKPDVKVVLVGPTGREPWWANRVERWGDSVRFFGELPHAQYIETMASASVCVDSFPISGGTAFPEALLNGKHVAALQNPIQGYTPADELRVDTVEQLVQRVIDLLAADPTATKAVEDARIKAHEAHSLDRFRDRVLAIYEGKCERCPWEHLVKADTYRLETTWKKSKKVNGIEISFFDLPFSFCLAFLARIYGFTEPPHSKVGAFALNLLILRALPTQLRNRLIRAREGSLKRV